MFLLMIGWAAYSLIADRISQDSPGKMNSVSSMHLTGLQASSCIEHRGKFWHSKINHLYLRHLNTNAQLQTG